MDSNVELTPGPEHFNSTGCIILNSKDKGRGVYASRPIPKSTIVEISPVLLFSKEEYESHGRYTVLDHYTFVWSEARMALALGLGSLFNHSEAPNVNYILDKATESIRYQTVRDIEQGEELCIFYGHNLWFAPTDADCKNMENNRVPSPVDDGWGGLSGLDNSDASDIVNPYLEGDQDEIIGEDELPFIRYKLPPEEEDPDSIKTVEAWVVEVPDQRNITTLLKWLKQSGLEGPELGHLKRIRKQGPTTTLLLCTGTPPPPFPENLDLPAPYLLPVPSSPALTLPSLQLKSHLWPTMYAPRRKDEAEPWTRGKLKWAWDCMKTAVDHAISLPIAALIPTDPSEGTAFIGHDTRTSTKHPLRHAAINTIRQLADHHASTKIDIQDMINAANGEEVRNGTNYLLTNRTFFITHEPCIMCSMALLHSRVKEIIYLYPMPKTGGSGGCACLPQLKGVNHRYTILQWKVDTPFGRFSETPLEIEASVDV
ncbi:hypothetical protein CVT24_007967 [Panaeolus cyanescens]|uniref:SET domain-containing protein n=1 Tax=Panaeolus cyanescens TaxID=181874 RepID=A0A409YQS0_9AGAR|nr:hypothetical protein CVT24_007967 [Panaeolus cyanescens]